MKKIFVIFTVVFLFSTLSAGCNKKEKACNKLYNRLVTCMEDLGIENKMKLSSKKNFIKTCEKNFNEETTQEFLKCVSRKTCKSFYQCVFSIKQTRHRTIRHRTKK